jgi:hypothetical protein
MQATAVLRRISSQIFVQFLAGWGTSPFAELRFFVIKEILLYLLNNKEIGSHFGETLKNP